MLTSTFDPFLTDFDRLVQRTFGWPATGNGVRGVLPMDGVRNENGVELRFDLPGADPESIEVTADRGVLTVSARRDQQLAENDKLYIRERISGSVARRIRLSETVAADKIEAAYHNGVLTVQLPLAEQAKPRKIEIKHEAKQEIAA